MTVCLLGPSRLNKDLKLVYAEIQVKARLAKQCKKLTCHVGNVSFLFSPQLLLLNRLAYELREFLKQTQS